MSIFEIIDVIDKRTDISEEAKDGLKKAFSIMSCFNAHEKLFNQMKKKEENNDNRFKVDSVEVNSYVDLGKIESLRIDGWEEDVYKSFVLIPDGKKLKIHLDTYTSKEDIKDILSDLIDKAEIVEYDFNCEDD